jgi:hypothetical protein
MDGRGSIHGRGNRFSPLHGFQTGSGPHPASDPMGTAGALPGVKAAGYEADLSPLSIPELENVGTIPLLPHTSSWRGV